MALVLRGALDRALAVFNVVTTAAFAQKTDDTNGAALAVVQVSSSGAEVGAAVTGAPTGTQAADQPLWPTNDLTGLRINTAAGGDTPLVAAVAGQTTRVHSLRLSVAGAVIVQIRDGATVLEVFNFAGVGGAVVLDFRSRPWYKTTANTALNINLSAAVQVDGRVEYVTSA